MASTGTDHVVVNATGSGNASCMTRYWGTRDSAGMVVGVRCTDVAGNAVDTPFVVEYVRST